MDCPLAGALSNCCGSSLGAPHSIDCHLLLISRPASWWRQTRRNKNHLTTFAPPFSLFLSLALRSVAVCSSARATARRLTPQCRRCRRQIREGQNRIILSLLFAHFRCLTNQHTHTHTQLSLATESKFKFQSAVSAVSLSLSLSLALFLCVFVGGAAGKEQVNFCQRATTAAPAANIQLECEDSGSAQAWDAQ